MPPLPKIALPTVALPARYSQLSQAERREVREEYMRLQFGKCHHCEGPLAQLAPRAIRAKRINWSRFPPNFLRHPVHLHHDHTTDLTIGAVHAYRNAVLWQYHGE